MKNKIIRPILLSVLGLFLGVRTVQAQGVRSDLFAEVGSMFSGGGPAGETTLGGLILSIINIFLAVAGLTAVLFLIIGGVRYIVAAGNEEQVESAKKTITHAIIGLVIITLSFVIVRVIANAFISGDV